MIKGISGNVKLVKGALSKILMFLKEELWVKGFGQNEQNRLQTENLTLVDLVDRARCEWEQAKTLFDEVEDPDLIDHAIYAMEAAERKYMYLLKKAKEEKIVDTSFYRNNGSNQAGGQYN